MFSNSQSNSGSGSGSSTCVMELQPPHHQHHHQDIPKPEPTYNGTGSLTPPNFNPSSSSSTTFTNNNKTFNAHPGEPRSYLDTEPRLVPSSIGLNGVQDEIELEQASGNVLGGTTAATATATEGVGGIEGGDENRDVPPEDATSVVSPPEIWNSSWINVCRVFGTFFSFTILGANDAAYGALIPYLETYYHLNYTIVSLIFLSPFLGYVLAALSNNRVHLSFGQRGVAIMGPGLHTLSYLAICLHPPYPILVVAYIFVGYGHGLLDAAWNAWLSNMANANEMMGFLHGFYGLGATLGPLVATSLIAKVGWPWYAFYYFMLGGSFIELAVLTASFWKETGKKHSRAPGQKKGQTREALTHRVPWTVAIFLLGYVGAEVALGGWLVTFMMRVRGGAPFESGMTVVGFWMGLTVGRVILGFVTGKIGERLAVIIYFIISMGLELLFWLVPRFHVSAVAVAFLGFFLGPLFPAAIVVATKLLPKHLHISAIGFAAACGGGGAALFPFAVGAIAERAGVQVLQPIVLGLLAVLLGIWLTLPRIKKHQSHST